MERTERELEIVRFAINNSLLEFNTELPHWLVAIGRVVQALTGRYIAVSITISHDITQAREGEMVDK